MTAQDTFNQDQPAEATGPVTRPEPEYAIALTRDDINRLPIDQYRGAIELVQTDEQAVAACRQLQQETILGFDTETRPSFRKGESYLPSLIQLAGSDRVYLFQLVDQRIPAPLKEVLGDPNIIKAGVALDFDLKQLRELDPFEPAGFVGLEEFAKTLRIKNQGLRGLAAALFGFRISKKAQCSNWSRKKLTDTQITYAATDAWISRKLYVEGQRRIRMASA